MSSLNGASPRVVPARLATLCLFNPSFGKTDETIRDQILFYYSQAQREREDAKKKDGSKSAGEGEEDANQRLRQVGLAQGMVDFAKNFSDGKPVDSIDTEKSRTVLHELEPGWWILASINLTQISHPAKAGDKNSEPHVEYSQREVAPSQLLLQQLLRAHSVFLLHHAPRLEDLYQRNGRSAFIALLENYWTGFAVSWDVLLHGNPIVDIYNGMKLAAGGELGVGVGEEDWGSGEREVLEDFVSRTEGLTDLVVSRLGDAPEQVKEDSSTKNLDMRPQKPAPWLGTEVDPRFSDGVIFSGTGITSRRSLATISHWMEAIFKYGDAAYGVGQSPSSHHRRKRRKLANKKSSSTDPAAPEHTEVRSYGKKRLDGKPNLRREAMERNAAPPGIPPPLVPAVEQSLANATKSAANNQVESATAVKSCPATEQDTTLFDTEKMMGYLKLGYGSSWTLSSKGLPANKVEEQQVALKESDKVHEGDGGKSDSDSPEAGLLQEVDPTPEVSDEEEIPFVQRLEQSIGKFIIGLSGDLENTEFSEDQQDDALRDPQQSSQRLFMRTLTIELTHPNMRSRRLSKASSSYDPNSEEPPTSASASADGRQPIINYQKLQVVVYVHQPFIFVFLFELHTPSLNLPAFYRRIHHQLGPLQKPLLASTDPSKVALRLADATGGSSDTMTRIQDQSSAQSIYDIVYDPQRLTLRTSIPNIPLPGSLAAEGLSTTSSGLTISGSWYTLGIPIGSSSSTSSPKSPASSLVKGDWTRVEALNVHTQMINIWIATRDASEVERTVKTGRGWWVLWMQVSDSVLEPEMQKEAFLIRKALDPRTSIANSSSKTASMSGKWLLRDQQREASGSSVASRENETSSAGVSEGIGVDARKYVESLLHLSR